MSRIFLLVGALSFGVVHAAPAKPDAKAIATKLAGDVAGVKEGDVVLIHADVLDAELAQQILLAVGARGGQPLMLLQPSRSGRAWFDAVPQKYDVNGAAWRGKLVEMVDVEFNIGRDEAPDQMNGIAADRLEAWRKTHLPFGEKLRKRKVRQIDLGNGLFPTRATAKSLGLSEAELATLFWAGVNTDYAKLAARGETVKAALAGAKELRITSKAGTDLKFKPSAKAMVISDGVITSDEAKAGGAGSFTWLPAGEAYNLIELGSAEGKVVLPRYPFRGEDLVDFTAIIKAGKIVEFTAKPSKALEAFKADYAAAGPGKEIVTLFDIGLNADVKAPKGKTIQSFVPEGSVSVFIGADTWAGGTNDINWSAALMMPDATLTVDGKPLIEGGVLKAK